MQKLINPIVSVLFLLFCPITSAQEFKRLPPDGKKIDPAVREALETRVLEIQHKIDKAAATSPDAEDWQPDVEVLVRAVRLALEQGLFFRQSETKIANDLLNESERRLDAVELGDRQLKLLGFRPEKGNQPQLLVGGFRSKIDNSVQPYGLVIPVGYQGPDTPYRTDVWLHGRGDTKTEIPFLHERMTRAGQYTPKNTIVLHPFGRHCNAFKFAGETDVYEALDHLKKIATLDDQRLSIRGFSMGGAGCWHFAVHDPGRWFAANPGAGFVDTIVYQGWVEKTPYPIDATRKKLMNWYDVLPWVNNLRNTRTIPYSGEKDKQKQAADRVIAETNKLGIEIPYIIGNDMGHRIDAASSKTIDETLSEWAERPVTLPRSKIDFTTYTLRYNKVDWLTITGLESHWKPSRIEGRIVEDGSLSIRTHGITRFEVDFCESAWPETDQRVKAQIDGQTFHLDDWSDAPGVQCEFAKGETWAVVEQIDPKLRKRPGLQGPIDDAFCDKFLFVAPSRPAQHGTTQRWINKEFKYAKERWSRLMRGDVNVVLDTELTEAQIKNNHLICFGDYQSNQYLRSIAGSLPIQWTKDSLKVGRQNFESDKCVPAFCFPNPRNPERYVVINSGMTYREFSNVSNSRQIPMLPDWAVLGFESENDAIFAGEVIAQGFFDEKWSLPE
ncbi:MAG: prolyl oligopeptidase family serine peptidase [Rubripirellula sp.]